MTCEKTDKKEEETKAECSGSMGPEMFEMMKKCCSGEGAFADCTAMMKSKMGAMTSVPCCGPGTGKTEPDRREK